MDSSYSDDAIPPIVFKEGHTFLGWDTDFTNVSGHLYINALWDPFTYTVTFDGNGGTLVLR